jgi:hypothetical protein
MSGCKPSSTASDWMPDYLAPDQARVVAAMAERIIPTTSTPGAKAALVDRYIDSYLKDVATQEIQAEFNAGLSELEELAKTKFENNFVKLSDKDKDAVLTEMAGGPTKEQTEAEKAAEMANEGEKVVAMSEQQRFFDLMRELTITGYFTSEIGAKQALKFDPIPGDYVGCIPYAEVGGTWAL